METKEYIDFINYLKENKIEFKPFTRTKWEFIEFILKNKEEVNKIGNLEICFELIRKYFRDGK